MTENLRQFESHFVPCLHHKVMASSFRKTHRLNSNINTNDPFLLTTSTQQSFLSSDFNFSKATNEEQQQQQLSEEGNRISVFLNLSDLCSVVDASLPLVFNTYFRNPTLNLFNYHLDLFVFIQ